MAKTNVTKADKTAIEAAQELIQKENRKAIDRCVEELRELQEKENEILKKHGCIKNIKGEFVNNQIEFGFVITKAEK